MGVINLGLLVEKIKKKLEGSGFIKNTDYATASAAGVVKVGEGLSITDAGVLSASGGSVGGVTLTKLWEGSLSTTETDIASALLDDYTDYVFLTASYKDSSNNVTPGNVLPVSAMGTAVNFINMGSQSFWITLTETAFKVKAGSSLTAVTLYGIK